jgi:AcrR family transcriptional regulator
MEGGKLTGGRLLLQFTYRLVRMSTKQNSKSETAVPNLLAAARTAFIAKNYADVTMDEIAKAAGVTKGALYHHFASKQALYLEMMHADLQEKRDLFRSAVERPGSCRARLSRLTERFLDLPPEKRDLIKLVRRDINIFKDPQREQLVRAYQAALPEQIEAVIREGIETGQLAPADTRLLSWMYVAMVEVMLTPYAATLFEDEVAMLEGVLDLFIACAGQAVEPSVSLPASGAP